jgi:glutamine cyclotransferase
MLRLLQCLSACIVLAAATPVAARAQTCPAPKPLAFHVESQIERDALGFTQGLEVHGDLLYESTGPIDGETGLNTIDRTGHVTPLAKFGKTFFGEGLTILGNEMFQLSWKDHKVFVYDLAGKRLREMPNAHDGWGLTNDGTSLIFTDGGDKLYFADPQAFKIRRSAPIRLGGTSIPNLNELELIDGKIYANVFMTPLIVRVIPETGCIDATADLSKVLWPRMSLNERERLLSNDNYVLNGIAYDRAKGTLFLTGKNWRWIFLGKFAPAD